MKYKVDFSSFICIEVEANNEDEAEDIAKRELWYNINVQQLVSNADITDIFEADEED